MPPPGPPALRGERGLSTIVGPLAAGLAVCAMAWLSLSLSWDGRAAAIWPANAVILACLVRSPPRRWAAFLACGLAGNFIADLLVADRVFVALPLALCNSAEIAACAFGLRRLAAPQLDLSRNRHLIVFGALATGTSAVSALAAAALLAWTSGREFLHTMLVWTMADSLGLVIVTPALLALNPINCKRFLAKGDIVRNLALLALMAAATAVTFLYPQLHMRYVVLLVLFLVAYKAETAGAALGLLVIALVTAALSGAGLGPRRLAADELARSAVMLQIFLLGSAVTAFTLAAGIARRRHLENALATSEHEFRKLAEHSTDIILRLDAQDTVLYVSPSCARYGYRPGDLIGRQGYELVHPDDLPRVRALIADLFSGSPPDPFANREQRLRAANGDWVWMEGSPQIVRDRDGAPIEVVSQLRDITARKLAEEALAQSETRYRLLTEHATDIILQVDVTGMLVYASPSCRALGYEPEEAVGRFLKQFIHPDDFEDARAHVYRQLSGAPEHAGQGHQTRVLRKDGSWVWLEGRPSLLRDDQGRPIGAVTLLRDVTERRAMEEELMRKRAAAEAAAVAKSEFLANMSHEIRTPLTGILGFAGLLEQVEDLPPMAARFANRIATAGQTLLSVVNDVLDFSKIEAGQIELDPRPFDPAAFVAETLELVAGQTAAKGLELRADIAAGMPGAVLADSSRVRQVLLNLLGNAIKFTDAGGVSILVEPAPIAGGGLRIVVTDTGVGIPAERVDRLFQRFSQVDSSITRRYGGSGLGLAICKNLAELMGGEIGVASQEGAGSTFWFSFAAPEAELEDMPPAPEPASYETPAARILVVDDVGVNRELVRAMLSPFGHDLTEARSGAEAVQAAMSGAFDLILMDLQMPGMDGMSATRAIREACEINRSTPIVALSANVLPEQIEACHAAGMDDHIAKPIDPTELLTKVAMWTAVAEADASWKVA